MPSAAAHLHLMGLEDCCGSGAQVTELTLVLTGIGRS
jgi:hypothetical protein